MFRVILDTDILSEIIKGIDQVVLQNASDYLDEYTQLSFTSISVYEVLYGLNARSAERQIQNFIESIAEHDEIVPSVQDYRVAANIRAALYRTGRPIGMADPIIAACSIERGVPLVTGNTQHYQFIRDAGFPLQLINWRTQQD